MKSIMADRAISYWRSLDWRIWRHSYIAETPEAERVAWISPVGHPGRPARSAAEHRQVLELIRHKDGIGAEFAMRDHVVASAREVLADTTGRPG